MHDFEACIPLIAAQHHTGMKHITSTPVTYPIGQGLFLKQAGIFLFKHTNILITRTSCPIKKDTGYVGLEEI